MSNRSHISENDESGEYAGEAVAQSNYDRVSYHVIVELVVAAQSDDSAPGQSLTTKLTNDNIIAMSLLHQIITKRVEYLFAGIHPNVGIAESIKIGWKQE